MSITVRDRALLKCFGDNVSELVFWAFRYFLGRRTIATCAFADSLAAAWPHIEPRTQDAIKRELDDAFRRDDDYRANNSASRHNYPLGMNCDRDAWEGVRLAYNAPGDSRGIPRTLDPIVGSSSEGTE